jgi:hypothetical protein
MDMDKIIELLTEFGVPFAYDHFAEGEEVNPPFICYLCPGSDNFAADGQVYLDINVVNIELYTDKKNPELEKKLQELLNAAGLVYEKNEIWIESEKLFEVLYEFEYLEM